MAGDVKVAVVSSGLSSEINGSKDFIKSGFGTPKACIVLLSFDQVDNTSVTAESKMSIGFSDFIGQYCITHQDEDASAKVDCDALKSNTRCYSLRDVNGSLLVNGIASAITNGVRLTHTDSTAKIEIATVIMFGGADLNVSLQRTAIASSQNSTVTIPHSGFTDGNDKLIFFIGTDIGAEDNVNSGINNSFGVCHATGSDAGGWTFTQRCMGWASDHNNAAGSPFAIISTDRVLDIITEAGTQDWGLEVTALDHSPAEWTVTTRDNGSGAGMEVYSLAIDLDDRVAQVGSISSPSSTGTWNSSGVGFKPQYVGMGVTALGLEDTIAANSTAGVHGISSNTGSGEETWHGWYNDNAAGTTNTNNNFRSRAFYRYNDDVGTLRHDISHLSFNTFGWSYTVNVKNGPNNLRWFYWAIEEAAVAGLDIAVPLFTYTLNDNNAPEIQTGVTIAPSTLAYTLNDNQIPQVGTSVLIEPPVEVYVLEDNNAPVIDIGVNVKPPAEIYTLTAQIPIVGSGAVVSVPRALFTLIAYIPVVATIDDLIIDIPLHSYVLNDNNAPLVSISVNILIPAEIYTLIAQIPIIGSGVSLIVPVEVFTLSSSIPLISIGINILVPAEIFTLQDNNAPLIDIGVNVLPPVEVYTLTALIPVASAGGINITPAVVGYTLSVLSSVINIGVNVRPPVEIFILQDNNIPLILTGVNVAVPAEIYTIILQVPLASAGETKIEPGVLSYTLNELSPLVFIDINIKPPVKVYILAELIPRVGTGTIVAPPVETFTLTNLAPIVILTLAIKPSRLLYTLQEFVPILHAVFPIAREIIELDLTPPFDDTRQLRYLFENFELVKLILEEGFTGQFTTADGKIVHVRNGIIIDVFN